MKKIHALSLAAVLLLAPIAPVSGDLPLASVVHAAAQQDTIKEYTRPAKTSADKDEERSVKAPVPWLLVEDHRIEALNANGKCVTYSSHPVLRVNGKGHPLLAHGLATWSKQEAQAAKRGFDFAYEYKKEDRDNGVLKETAYFDYSVITKWGRVDENMISFCSFAITYAGGIHPMHGKGGTTFDTRTGKEVPLAALVTNREALLQALAAAFHAQYPGREEELFAFDIREQLERIHPAEKGLDTFSWYMGTRGELVFLYPPYALAPYASGDFTLTIERADAPQLFIDAYSID
ncbi:RsiV family protein [Selenomonas sputigena]|uniref:RsiV family protein n=1 Tax=Selenomonas sputigena TaxID=69823 RepID=UPI002234E25D|nr:RsiV family protein [Selenomonas sputigena]UZE45690.1 RsiV family protein [Selenomonas sputigena]